jgi:hypothetical protein
LAIADCRLPNFRRANLSIDNRQLAIINALTHRLPPGVTDLIATHVANLRIVQTAVVPPFQQGEIGSDSAV